MLIKIRNFGPIKAFDFDLDKDLIAIFGKNNIGKSYAISASYLLIKNLLQLLPVEHYLYYLYSPSSEDRNKLDNLVENIKNRFSANVKTKEIEISSDIKFLLKEYSQFFVDKVQQSFMATFEKIDYLNNKFSQEKFSIYLSTDLVELELGIENQYIAIKKIGILDYKILVKQSQKNRRAKPKTNIITLYLSKDDEFFKKNMVGLIIYFWKKLIKPLESILFTEQVYYLPASRSGLYQALNAFSRIFVELSKKRHLLKSKLEIPVLSEPISDYFLKLSEIEVGQRERISPDILSIVDKIEQTILQGQVIFDERTKKLFYKSAQTGLELDVSLASSMVSEISPIVAYLKYIIAFQVPLRRYNQEKMPYLFIEEPEAHLHPEVQIQLMEIFAELAQAGVKIVMTSHSNYMFNKMNNLILGKKLAADIAQIIVFKETNEGSIATNIPIDELGADDENFLDAAEQLFNEKIELIEKLNAEKD
jgi:predicted ATPase